MPEFKRGLQTALLDVFGRIPFKRTLHIHAPAREKVSHVFLEKLVDAVGGQICASFVGSLFPTHPLQ